VLLLAVALFGCRGFARPGASRQDFYRELSECRKQEPITGADIQQAVVWGGGLNNSRYGDH